MDDKIKILLDKINMDETSYPYFSDAKIIKIKINSKNIYICTDENILFRHIALVAR